MKAEQTSFYQWQKRFNNDHRCLAHLHRLRWPDGFACPHCGHDHGYRTGVQWRYECQQCHRQSSVTSGTLFHATKLPLTKWFWAIYWLGTDKGGISALRLSKLIGVTWRTAYRMLRKLRTAMGHQDSIYRLSNIVELDDAVVGGKRAGKPGRGAQGKTSVLVACENRDGKPGFLAMQAVASVNKVTVLEFAHRQIKASQTICTDGLAANNGVRAHATHVAMVTPPTLASEWLPWVHVAIANLKRFLLGTFHGISQDYLQEYLNEFCYRFNRRFWEAEIPNRLMRLCVQHTPIRFRETVV